MRNMAYDMRSIVLMAPNIPENSANTNALRYLRQLYNNVAILIQMHTMLWLDDNGSQILVENRRAGKLKA